MRNFYKGTHCVFLTYDVTNADTFESLSYYLNEVKEHAPEDVRLFIVGNKCEMEDQR